VRRLSAGVAGLSIFTLRESSMSGNTIGKLFCVTSFGESHGPAIGCVVDGCPPGLAISEADIQAELDRRKPGTSRHVTQRREPDSVEILSGCSRASPPAPRSRC
jgi:chorismate synthase